MIKIKDNQFLRNFETKLIKSFDLSEQGFELQIFSNFPTQDLNFHGRWGWRDQILARKLKFVNFTTN